MRGEGGGQPRERRSWLHVKCGNSGTTNGNGKSCLTPPPAAGPAELVAAVALLPDPLLLLLLPLPARGRLRLAGLALLPLAAPLAGGGHRGRGVRLLLLLLLSLLPLLLLLLLLLRLRLRLRLTVLLVLATPEISETFLLFCLKNFFNRFFFGKLVCGKFFFWRLVPVQPERQKRLYFGSGGASAGSPAALAHV